MRNSLILCVVLLATAAPSLAQDQPAAPASPPAPATLACTNSGMRYQLGDFACIAACHGQRRLARCDAVSEQPKWTYVQDSCPNAMLNQPWPSEWSEVPADAVMSPKPVNVNRSAVPVEDKLIFTRFTDVLASAQ